MPDVFLCHASADKAEVVLPLYAALSSAGYSCWLDDVDVRWGDSISSKIAEGLRDSKFVLVVLSPSFMGRTWTEHELRAALHLETSAPAPRLLPLLVGTATERADLLRQYPLLADKNHVIWSGRTDVVVDALRALMQSTDGSVSTAPVPQSTPTTTAPYLPKIAGRVTQRDRDRFTRSTFDTICEHFQRGLSALEDSGAGIEGDFEHITSRQMHANIYRDGELAAQCQIFSGAQGMQNTIGFHWGAQMGTGNAVNGWLSINEDGGSLAWSTDYADFGAPRASPPIDPANAAEFLWRRFVAPLEWRRR